MQQHPEQAAADATAAASSSSARPKRHALLSKPLYALQLPQPLLHNLRLRSIDVQPRALAPEAASAAANHNGVIISEQPQQQPQDSPSSTQPHAAAAQPHGTASTATATSACAVCPGCPPQWSSSAQMRAHLRTDWHRYNLALSIRAKSGRLRGAPLDAARPLKLDEFEHAVESLTDAADADSDSAISETADAPSDARSSVDHVSALLRKLDVASAGDGDGAGTDSEPDDAELEEAERRTLTARDPWYWFVTRPPASRDDDDDDAVHFEQTQLGVYRAVLSDAVDAVVDGSAAGGQEALKATRDTDAIYLAALQATQAEPIPIGSIMGPFEFSAAGNSIATEGRVQPNGLSKLKGGKGVDEAAALLGANFLEAKGVLGRERPPRAQRRKQEDDDDDDDAASSGSELERSDVEPEPASGRTEDGTSASAPSASSRLAPPVRLRLWTIILLGGGHFSAAIVALNPSYTPPTKRTRAVETRFLVLAHKAFHRYTTRKKQGGGQAAQDATGRFAKSAGALLRRYGEQALGDEVRALLASDAWRRGVERSEKVWVRAGARGARGVLWSWNPSAAAAASIASSSAATASSSGGGAPGQTGSAAHQSPLDAARRDGRVQGLPFNTRRATVGEALRAFAELSRVRVKHDSEEELARRDEAYRAQLQGGAREREERRRRERERARREREAKEAKQLARLRRGAAAAAAEAQLSEAEARRRERLERLAEMVLKGRVEACVNHLAKYEAELLRVDGWDAEPGATEAAATATGGPDEAEGAGAKRKTIDAPLPEWWRRRHAREKGVLRSAAEVSRNEAGAVYEQPGHASQLVPGTLLQLAAEGGHEDMVNYLLVERRADPALGVPPPPLGDEEPETELGGDADEAEAEAKVKAAKAQLAARFPHRTAYDLCASRPARDVFRRLMASQPAWCDDWSGAGVGGARVPSALTAEMEERQAGRARDRRAMMRDKAKAREAQRSAAAATAAAAEEEQQAREEEARKEQREPPATNGGGVASKGNDRTRHRLGGGPPRALVQQALEAASGASLTPEMRQRIERERRARAAEARMRAMAGQGPPSSSS